MSQAVAHSTPNDQLGQPERLHPLYLLTGLGQSVRGAWGLLAGGAVCLLIARLYIALSPQFMNDDVQHAIGAVGIALTIALPKLLLTFGLAGIVWGLWGHERWLKQILR